MEMEHQKKVLRGSNPGRMCVVDPRGRGSERLSRLDQLDLSRVAAERDEEMPLVKRIALRRAISCVSCESGAAKPHHFSQQETRHLTSSSLWPSYVPPRNATSTNCCSVYCPYFFFCTNCN